MEEVKTETDLQALIDNAGECGAVTLNDDYTIGIAEGKFVLGWKKCQKAVQINQEGVLIDGNNKKLKLVLSKALTEDIALIEITSKAKYAEIRNLLIEIEYNGPNSGRTIYAFRNLAKNVKLNNCRIKMLCSGQVNMTAVFNDGTIDTTLESGADQLKITDCHFEMHSFAIDYALPQILYGIYNNLGNSIAVSGNYMFIQNRGNGERQQAVGLFNSGRYVRINNNNIKANGNHNIGKQLENCYATGIVNHGECLLLTGNNIVGEWGGQCLGLVNYANHVKIDGNKILATHTIKGSSIRQYGVKGLIVNNIVISTSRNPRLIEILADDNIVQSNMINALLRNECYSGCGVYIMGSAERKLRHILVTGNNICGVVDAGVVLHNCEACAVTDNIIEGVRERSHFISVLDTTKSNKVSGNITDDGLTPNSGMALDNLNENRIVSVQ